MQRIRILICASLLLSMQASAQEFKKVVEIVVDMEASLKKLINDEKTQREKEMENLKTELQTLRTSITDSALIASSNPTITEQSTTARIDVLEQKYAALDIKENPSPVMGELTSQLTTLVTELKSSIQEDQKVQQNTQKALNTFQQFAQFSGQVFSFFSYTTNGIEGKDYNRFDIDRMYLTAKGQVFENAKVQFTTDIFRNGSVGSYYPGLALRLKFGYLDYTPIANFSLKLGMIPGPWFSVVDGLWKYRGVAPSVGDKGGYFSSADVGVSFQYTLPEKIGELSAFILNGSGYTAAETNRFKDFAVRANVTPFVSDAMLKTLTFAGYIYMGSNANSTTVSLLRNRFGGIVGYSYAIASFNVEYNIRKDAFTHPDTITTGNSLSLFGEVKAPIDEWKNVLSLVWRLDVVEPNEKAGGDMTRFSIVGLSYKPSDKLTFVLDRQYTDAETHSIKRNDGAKMGFDNRWILNAIINF